MNQTNGIHHITAIAGDPNENHRFYTHILGLRLVKKTVNFDDPTTYHLYYGNGTGSPGTILTFFPWQDLPKGKPDRGQVVAISFSVPAESQQFWINRLANYEIEATDIFERFGQKIIGFQDPDGLHLELVFDPQANSIDGWSDGPLSTDYAIRGIYGATLAEKEYKPTGQLLEDHLGFKQTDQSDDHYLYKSEANMGSAIEIIDQFGPNGKQGKGTVHHIAFRTKDQREQQELSGQLFDRGYHLTDVKDRDYFKSVYFHEPGGILFELATDPPGFTIDETADSLGTSLKLPSWLEDQRHRIEAELPPLD